MSRFPKILGAILLALGLAGVLMTNLATSSLIVSIGVRAIEGLKVAGFIVAGVGALTAALGFVPDVKRLIASSNSQKLLDGKNAERRKTFDAYAKDSLNPLKTRERLADLKESNARLTGLVDRCLAQMDRMDKLLEQMKKAANACAASPLGKLSRAGAQGRKDMETAAAALQEMADSCILCESVRENMERYLHTVFHLVRSDSEFRRALMQGKGVCLPHLADLLRLAPQELSGKELAEFVEGLCANQAQQARRIQEDISWFIRKFDYRFSAEPWKNSQDAVPRTVNKLRGWCVGPEPNPKE